MSLYHGADTKARGFADFFANGFKSGGLTAEKPSARLSADAKNRRMQENMHPAAGKNRVYAMTRTRRTPSMARSAARLASEGSVSVSTTV